MADRTVKVRLEAVTAQFQARLAEAGVSVKALETKVAGFHTNMKKADLSAKGLLGSLGDLSAGTLAAGAAAAIAGAAFLKMAKDGIKHFVELADAVRKFERVTGASAEESSLMIERARVLGVSTDALDVSFFRLSQNIETNRDELAKHGVEIARTKNGSVDLVKTFDSLVAAYHRAGQGQEANRITQLALSRGAIQLLPLLNATREQLEEIDAAAARHHMILTDQDLKNALEYKIALHEMRDSWVGIEQELAKGVLPLITKMVEDVTNIVEGLDKAAHAHIPGGGTGPIPRNLGGFVGDAIKRLPGINEIVLLNEALGGNDKAAKAATAAEEQLKAQLKANDQAVKDYAASLDMLYAGTFGMSDATDKFESDLAGAYSALKKAKDGGDKFASSLATSSTSGLKNRAMLRGLETDLSNAAKKYKELHPQATDDEIRKALSGQIAQLQVLLTYFSGDNAEAQKLRGLLNDIAGIDLSKPGKTYNLGWGVHLHNPFGGGDAASPAAAPPPPIDTTPDAGSKPDVGAYLQSLWEQRMEQIKNRFHSGQASLAEYERSLTEQMAREKPWTDKWVELQQEKADAVHYWTDAVGTYLKALADKQANLEDNMFKVGDLSTDAYVQILERRLAALQKYSDEWVDVYEKIIDLENKTLDSELKIIEAYEAGRHFQLGFDQLASQRETYAALTPGGAGGSTTMTTYGASYSPTFQIATANPYAAATTANEQLRNYAAMAG